jgi:integrase/recombinase XerD
MSADRELKDPHGFEVLVASYLEWLRSHNYSEDTARSRQRLLGYLVEWLELRGLTRPQDVTKPVLERYQRWLYLSRKPDGRPLSFVTQQQRLIALRMFFKWLARMNLILSNPASDLEMPRREMRLPKAVLTAAEVERVMATADPATVQGLRNRAILETFYATGMRRKELVALKLFDLDFERETVFIRQGKGKKDRLVPIGPRALSWLNQYLKTVRPELVVRLDEGHVFLNDTGEPFTPGAMTELVRRLVRRASLTKTGSCHLFRHTMATLMLENGADIRFIQEMLGHANLNTTEVYTRVSIRKLQEIYAATHPAGRASEAEVVAAPAEPPAVE